MSAQTMDEAFAPVEDHYRNEVLKHTFGHVAPMKNRIYRGHITFAVGCFGDDNLNPTVLECELKNRTLGELDSSPWFYSALSEFLSDMACRGKYGDDQPSILEVGKVYRWTGTFRNYNFDGQVIELSLAS